MQIKIKVVKEEGELTLVLALKVTEFGYVGALKEKIVQTVMAIQATTKSARPSFISVES